MHTYEILVVFKPFIDGDNAETALKALDATIQNLKGKVVKTERLGRKRLAYEIDKFKDGFLATFLVQLPEAGVVDFRKHCQLNEDILRLTLLRMEEKDLAAIAAMAANPRRGDRDRPERGERGDRGDRPHPERRGGPPPRGDFNRGPERGND